MPHWVSNSHNKLAQFQIKTEGLSYSAESIEHDEWFRISKDKKVLAIF